jgi:hypothetical protein
MSRKFDWSNWSVVKTVMTDGRIKIGIYHKVVKVAPSSGIIAGPLEYRDAIKCCEKYCRDHPGLIKVGFASLLDLRDQLRTRRVASEDKGGRREA